MSIDLVLEGDIVNVNTGEILEGEIGIENDEIRSVKYDGSIDADKRYEANFIAPGFVEGHIHIESSLLSPLSFSKVVIPHGTTSVVADPHEIANVLGYKGIEFFSEESKRSPLRIFLDVPSCVPASSFEFHGVEISADDVKKAFNDIPEAISLGEVMDISGVLNEHSGLMKKIKVAEEYNKIINGHAPGLTGDSLIEYVEKGICSDHESTSTEEALEKLRLGMHIMAREGSTEENLLDVISPVINGDMDPCNFSMVSDDRDVSYLLNNGHLDHSVRKAVSHGLDPVKAIQMVTINTADHFNLDKLGSIDPGNKADLVTFDDLDELKINKVFIDGNLVAEDGSRKFKEPDYSPPAYVSETMGEFKVSPKDLSVHYEFKDDEENTKVRSIKALDTQVITKETEEVLPVEQGIIKPDPDKDVLKISTVQRNGKRIETGFVNGFKMKQGAIAESISHDAHNIIGMGTNSEDLALAINKVKDMNGGLAIAKNKNIIKKLKLEIAGLMSEEEPQYVKNKEEKLHKEYKELGGELNHPFMTLSFLGLSVIPELKITPEGLVKIDPETNEMNIVPVVIN